MDLLIYEYFSAGTQAGHDDLLCQGWAMLDALLQGFIGHDELVLHTVLDSRLRPLWEAAPYAGQVHVHWARPQIFTEILEAVEAVLIVAPEQKGISYQLTRLAEEKQKIVLGSSASSIEIAGHKKRCKVWLEQRGIPVPQTVTFSFPDFSDCSDVHPLLVLKPVQGTGGHEVRRVSGLEEGKRQLRELSVPEDFLLEEYIPGEAVSVSCLVADGKALPLALNQQLLTFAQDIDFRGVRVGYRHRWEEEGRKTAQAACESIPGLRGFVGVDLVFSSDGPVLIEINPRITLAYPPLQHLFPKMANYLLKTCMQGELPSLPSINKEVTFLLEG